MRQERNLFVQAVRFDLQLIKFREHQFLRLLTPRLLLALAYHDVAQNLIFARELGRLLGIRAGQLRLLQLAGGVLELTSQRGHLHFEVFILFFARRQLRAQIFQLLLRLSQFLLLFRLVFADLANSLFRRRQLLL